MNRWAPFYRLWLTQRGRTAQLHDLLHESEHELALTKGRLRIAIDQRDRAMDLVMASEWTPADLAALHDMGVEPS